MDPKEGSGLGGLRQILHNVKHSTEARRKGEWNIIASSSARGPAALGGGSVGRSAPISWNKEIFHAGGL